MSNDPSRSYEENYLVLERITESLNKDEIGIDDLVEKTREALDAARTCMEILNTQKGEFKKLETEFAQLLQSSASDSVSDVSVSESTDPPVTTVSPEPPLSQAPPSAPVDIDNLPPEAYQDDSIGEDDPF